MKWAMIVSFYLAGEWHTAEQLQMRDWYRIMYRNAELCILAQHQFTDNNPDITQIRASCEPIPTDAP